MVSDSKGDCDEVMCARWGEPEEEWTEWGWQDEETDICAPECELSKYSHIYEVRSWGPVLRGCVEMCTESEVSKWLLTCMFEDHTTSTWDCISPKLHKKCLKPNVYLKLSSWCV